MNKIYFPIPKKLIIRNFSLYPQNLEFTFEFIKGLNLIIGGNGLGKTTFLNIFKYALIGLYKDGVTSKYREYENIGGRRYNKREKIYYEYFKNRMDFNESYNSQAEVTLNFTINDLEIEVTRDLFEPKVKKVVIINSGDSYEIKGAIVTQKYYDDIYNFKEDKELELQNTLQNKYENLVQTHCNTVDFDEIVSIVNKILFFNETRESILWDEEFQKSLVLNYFVDKSLKDERNTKKNDAKYFDSVGRHKGEDLRAIKKIYINNLNIDNKSSDKNRLFTDIEKCKVKIEKIKSQIEQVQAEREREDTKLRILYSDRNNTQKQLKELETRKIAENNKKYKEYFDKLTPKYQTYYKFIKATNGCPMCNQHLSEEFVEHIVQHEDNCFLCGNSIIEETQNIQSNQFHIEIEMAWQKNTNIEKDILLAEEELKKLDDKFGNLVIHRSNLDTELRRLQFLVQQNKKGDKSSKFDEFELIQARINVLEREKNEAYDKSKKFANRVAEIDGMMEEQILETRNNLSETFNLFAKQFLGLKCELVYDNPRGSQEKRYIPKIANIMRENPEELSESQRFFIDQSFRMSLLNFFNQHSPTFFMCETPDASLDASYEENAAKIYLEYIKTGNVLILTSNLNKSEFLEYVITNSPQIKCVNLLDIGKKSTIQSESRTLFDISSKIEKLINEK